MRTKDRWGRKKIIIQMKRRETWQRNNPPPKQVTPNEMQKNDVSRILESEIFWLQNEFRGIQKHKP